MTDELIHPFSRAADSPTIYNAARIALVGTSDGWNRSRNGRIWPSSGGLFLQASTQQQPFGLIQMAVPLALCVWGAMRDRAYKKAGGIKPDKFEKIVLLATVLGCVLFLWASVYIVSPEFAGTMGALLIVVVFGVWEIHRWQIRRKNPAGKIRRLP